MLGKCEYSPCIFQSFFVNMHFFAENGCFFRKVCYNKNVYANARSFPFRRLRWNLMPPGVLPGEKKGQESMDQKNTAVSGSIKISEEVVETVVKTVLKEIDGVHSLAARSAGASDLLLRMPLLKPISITLNADIAAIDVAVNLCFGYRVKTVSEQIQQRVKDAVQDMTGVTVSRVDVYVAGIKAREAV